MTIRDFHPLPDGSEESFAWLFHDKLVALTDALCAGRPQGAMYVGGCVRDSLLARPPQIGRQGGTTDIDIATVLTPDETIEALRRAGIKAIPTGYDHGTITAVADEVVAEITSLRADVETDGRHAVVQYTDDWDQDWRRRDFTINAIYLTPEGRLYDPASGLDDLAARRVAFIGDPEGRIREDYLRILRFYRFSGRFAARFDPAGSAACRKLTQGLGQVSAERVGQELMKILAGPQLPLVLKAMEGDNILPQIWLAPADVACASRLDGAAAEIVLAALWPDAAGIELDHALRLSNHQGARRRAALDAASRFQPLPGEAGQKEQLYRLGEQTYTDGLILAEACAGQEDGSQWQAAQALPSRWQAPAFPLSGKDFAAEGLKPGPEMGAALARAEALWIKAGYPEDDATLAGIITRSLRAD